MAFDSGGELRGTFSSRTWIAIGVLTVLVLLAVAIRSTPNVRTLLLICAGLFVIERTFGDWLADRLGDTFGKLTFLAAFGAVSWGLFGTELGRSALTDLLALAGHEAQTSPVTALTVPASTRPPSAASSTAPSSPKATGATTVRQVQSGLPGEGSAVPPDTAGTSGGANTGVLATRTMLRASVSADGRSVDLEARVSAAGATVSSGHVEFSVDGRALATTSVDREGTARTTVNLPSGVVKVTARYAGSGRFRESVDVTYVSR